MNLKVIHLRRIGKSSSRSIQLTGLQFLTMMASFTLPLVIVGLLAPAVVSGGNSPSSSTAGSSSIGHHPVDKCFCKVDSPGEILAGCSCSASTIDEFNRNDIYPKVSELVRENYFRYFQVNFNKPCKFWADDDGLCSRKACSVSVCDATVPEDIVQISSDDLNLKKASRKSDAKATFSDYIKERLPWLHPYYETLTEVALHTYELTSRWLRSLWGSVSSASGGPSTCLEKRSEDLMEGYHEVDTQISGENLKALNEFCSLDPLEANEACNYIDLKKNSERFTGYTGESSWRIWRTIYKEICFQPEKDDENGMCAEKEAFFRIVSGLQTSITVHLCKDYPLKEENPLMGQRAEWGPNVAEFRRRFDPDLTQGQGPDWLKNLYFIYLVELRAIGKAGPQILPMLESAGPGALDPRAVKIFGELVARAQEFPYNFDEHQMFNPDKVENRAELLAEFKSKFRQISLLMDCMGCERCRVWGKLQVTGVGTALKILFTPEADLQLTRHEVVALINGFTRLATSVDNLHIFRQ